MTDFFLLLLFFLFNTPSVLESVAVQRVFLNKLINVALAWHQNFPKLPPAPSRFLRCSDHAIKNTRRKMEDKHVALAKFNQLFGIQVQDFHCNTKHCHLSLVLWSCYSQFQKRLKTRDQNLQDCPIIRNISNTFMAILCLSLNHGPGWSGTCLLCCF